MRFLKQNNRIPNKMRKIFKLTLIISILLTVLPVSFAAAQKPPQNPIDEESVGRIEAQIITLQSFVDQLAAKLENGKTKPAPSFYYPLFAVVLNLLDRICLQIYYDDPGQCSNLLDINN